MDTIQLLKEFTHSGFFVLRTPLLPFDEMMKWSEGVRAPAALDDAARLESAYALDVELLRARLLTLVERAEVREALFVASPDLEESFARWRRDPGSRRGQRIERALVRYFSRMAGRATPFGLFAGWSVGTIGDATRLRIAAARPDYRRHTRLDMDYLYALVFILERDPALRRGITHRPNQSIYRAAGRLRYVESRPSELFQVYQLVAIETTDYLEAALAAAEHGGVPSELASRLVAADSSFSPEEARDFVNDLIENQLLLSDLIPALTGDEPVPVLISELQKHEQAAHVAGRLSQARAMLERLDADGLGNSPEQYRAIAASLRELPAEVNISKLFQADMMKPAPQAVLGGEPLKEIARGVELLHRLKPPDVRDILAPFRRAFTERYGEERDVPLTEALDEDVGVGFRLPGAASSDDLPADDGARASGERARQLKRREAHLLSIYVEALARGAREVMCGPADLAGLECGTGPPMPDAFEVMATLAAASEAELEKGNFRVFIRNLVGPSGVSSLGRFCHADKTLERHVRDHLRAEESLSPEAVFAEVVHLPGGRTANILLRPVLREYEIPYLGRGGASPERQIAVTDLLVSVHGKRVVLRSRRLQREVIPRLTTAHNFKVRGMNVYQFLGALQAQRVTGKTNWDWGHLSNAAFLPRVTVGRLVLSKAHWSIGKDELLALGATRSAERFRAVQQWRARRALPRFVALADADNELIIDLDNVLSVETFIELVKGLEAATLVEMFPAPEELCAQGPEGRFVHELIVPFIRTDSRPRCEPHSSGPSRFQTSRRTFPPGSEWLYAKLYTGSSTADYVLRDVVRPIVREAIRAAHADGWFFMRYADPEQHIRLRIHGTPETLHARVLPALNAALSQLFDDGRLWRVQIDTYEREVERYGGDEGILLAEQLFHADSEAVLSIIEALTGNEGAQARWLLAYRGVDMILEDFGLDTGLKLSVIERMLESYWGEILSDIALRRKLRERYRRQRSVIEQVLDTSRDESKINGGRLYALRLRSDRLNPIVAQFKALELNERLSRPLSDLLSSFVHMHLNRSLQPAQRSQELTLLYLLARFYESRKARRDKL